MKAEDFYLQVASALTGCQLVEQELKLYITEAFALIQKTIAGKLPFTMSGEDYADASLERLIQAFRKLTNNAALVKDLERFKTERNFLSHRGITYCLDRDDEVDNGAVERIKDRLAAIEPEAQRLRSAIHEEASKFRAYLWFEDLSGKN